MHDEWEDYAQRAGREFVAAGRAETAAQRRRHRASAESHQEMVRKLKKPGPSKDAPPR
jgi:hypothetical protein